MAWEVDLSSAQEYFFVTSDGDLSGLFTDSLTQLVAAELDRAPHFCGYRQDGGHISWNYGVVRRTPETRDPQQVALSIRAYDEEVLRAARAASVPYSRALGREVTIDAMKAAVDPAGHARTSKEIVAFPLDVTFAEAQLVCEAMAPFLVARPYFTERGSAVQDGDSWAFAISPLRVWPDVDETVAALQGGKRGERIRMVYPSHGPTDSDAMNILRFAMTSLVFTSSLRHIRADGNALGDSLPRLLTGQQAQAYRMLNGIDRNARIPVRLHNTVQWMTSVELLDFFREHVSDHVTDLDGPQTDALRNWDYTEAGMKSPNHVNALGHVEWIGMERMLTQANLEVLGRAEPPMNWDETMHLQTTASLLEQDAAKLARRNRQMYGLQSFGRVFTPLQISNRLMNPTPSNGSAQVLAGLVKQFDNNPTANQMLRPSLDGICLTGSDCVAWFSLADVQPAAVDELVARIVAVFDTAGVPLGKDDARKAYQRVRPDKDVNAATVEKEKFLDGVETTESTEAEKGKESKNERRWWGWLPSISAGYYVVLLTVPRLLGWAYDHNDPDRNITHQTLEAEPGERRELVAVVGSPHYETKTLWLPHEIERRLDGDGSASVVLSVDSDSTIETNEGFVTIGIEGNAVLTAQNRRLHAVIFDEEPGMPYPQNMVESLEGNERRHFETHVTYRCDQADQASRTASVSILTGRGTYRIGRVIMRGCHDAQIIQDRDGLASVADEMLGRE